LEGGSPYYLSINQKRDEGKTTNNTLDFDLIDFFFRLLRLERWIGSLSPFKNAGKQRQKAKVQKF
jgi:hypothetical protein